MISIAEVEDVVIFNITAANLVLVDNIFLEINEAEEAEVSHIIIRDSSNTFL